MKFRYSILIQWSDEDQLYLVTLPEFAEIAMQPSTYGQTYEDAVKNAQEAIEGYLAYCEEADSAIPTPNMSPACLDHFPNTPIQLAPQVLSMLLSLSIAHLD